MKGEVASRLQLFQLSSYLTLLASLASLFFSPPLQCRANKLEDRRSHGFPKWHGTCRLGYSRFPV